MSEIVNGRRSVTADTALRLARYFAMTPQFWMNLQAAYDLDLATRALGGQNQTRRASARGPRRSSSWLLTLGPTTAYSERMGNPFSTRRRNDLC